MPICPECKSPEVEMLGTIENGTSYGCGGCKLFFTIWSKTYEEIGED